jgi:ligand-binding sensor domain-containing protein/signal transduction histidine kinase
LFTLLTLLLLLAVLPLPVDARPALVPLLPPPSATFRFEHLGIEQGLSQSTVTAILQDSFGFMWFGTDDGLNRYDGYQFTVFRYDPDDPASLSQGGIREIYEDKAGALWLRTASGGFDRYDRDRNVFIHYRRDDGGIGARAEDFVWDLYEDRSGTIWAGTYLSGLYRYDRAADRFIHFGADPANPDSLSDDRVYAIYEDRAGLLWIGTAQGLDRFDREPGRFVHFRADPADPATLAGERVQLIFEDRAGRMWVATYGTGLNLFDRQSGRVTRYVHDPQDPQSIAETNRILELYEDRAGYIWVRHFDGRLDRFDPTRGVFRRFRHDPAEPEAAAVSASLAHDNASFVREDRNGNLWIGMFGGGLDRYDAAQDRFVHYRHTPYDQFSLSDNQLLTFWEDRAGGLWFGTYGHGLSRFDPAQWQFPHYRIEPQAADAAENNIVLDVRVDRAGLVWIGSTVGLSSLDRAAGQTTRYRHDPQDPTSLGAERVWSVFEDSQGRLWVGTETSLDLLDRATGRFTHYRNAPTADNPSEAYGPVTAITDDGAGGLWLGVFGRGLERFDPAQEKFTHYEYHLTDPSTTLRTSAEASRVLFWNVWAVQRDRAGWLWIGTTRGLYRLNPDTGAAVRYTHDPANPASLSTDEIHSIAEDRQGRLWFGAWQGGLNQLDQAGKFVRYAVKDGLPNNTVYCILEDAAGRLWLSTNRGLARFDPATRGFTNYDVGDGLQSNEFNTGSCSTSAAGELLFGGVNGFNAFYPDRVAAGRDVPPVVLTSLTREGKSLALGAAPERLAGLTLRWPADAFEFEFASLSYSQPAKNRYAYMLAPFEKEWTHVGGRRFGSYTNLPGGTYTLRLRGSNSAGVWNEEGASITITVIPPFWETWPFWGLVGLTLAGLAAAAYRWRIASVENRNRELALEVADRTLTIAQQTADLQALYQADEELERHVQLDEVLQALVDIAVDVLHADKSAVLAWDDRRERLVMRVARNFSPQAISQIAFAPGEGFVGRVMATGEPVTVEDATVDLAGVPERPEVVATVLAEGIRSFMHIPIRVAAEGMRAEDADRRPPTADRGVIARPVVGAEAIPSGTRDCFVANDAPRNDVGAGEVFGVFNVCYNEPRAFGEREQRLFTALAQRAALAVQTAQHFAAEQRRAEQFRVISEVGRGLASILDINALLAEIVRLIQRAFGYDHVGLALIEGDEAVYRVGAGKLWDASNLSAYEHPERSGASFGGAQSKDAALGDARSASFDSVRHTTPDSAQDAPLGSEQSHVAFVFKPNRLKVGSEGITGWVAGSGEPQLVPDVSQEPRYVWMEGSSTRSELAVPLKAAGKIIGVLDAQSERLNAFDASDLTVMQSLANQAAIAIENARLYENLGRQVAQLTALQETNRAVASTLERDALLKLIMEQATGLLRADGGIINLVDWEQYEDEVVAASGAAAGFVGARNSLDDGLSGWVATHNQPIISNRLSQDGRIAAELLRWLEEGRVESAALAPLAIGGQVVGTLVLIKEVGRGGFEQADLDLLVAFADQAAIAIENARLYEEAQQLAATQERSRLARDLHDAVTQTLFSASLIAEVLPALWESDPTEGRQLLGELRQLTRGALAEMRTLLLELRPAALIEANLGDLLRQLAESVSGRTGIPVAVSLEGCPLPDLPDEVHVALYRIAQEALNNVIKHAQAKRAEVRLTCAGNFGGVGGTEGAGGTWRGSSVRVVLRIADDGRGFDPATVSPEHLGLGIIRERAQAISAQLRVESGVGEGTVVEVTWS